MPDLFRETPIRYLGYANEVGEAFRGVVPPDVVRFSYKVAFCYVACDTLSKSIHMFAKQPSRPDKVLVAAGDVLIWQTLASVVVPGFTINRICALTKYLLSRHAKTVAPHVRSGLVVAAGLLSIPLIIHPIDTGVSCFMDGTYRKIFGRTY